MSITDDARVSSAAAPTNVRNMLRQPLGCIENH
jgi:hypothetical protein